MDSTTLLLFAGTFATILVIPGPNSAIIIGHSLKFGFRRSALIPIGFSAATGIHAILTFSGVAALVQENELVLGVLKWLGIGYLVYLAYKAFSQESNYLETSNENVDNKRTLFFAMFVSLTNPKALFSSLMLYPLFIDQNLPFFTQAISLTFVAMLVSLVVYSMFGLAAGYFRSKLEFAPVTNRLTGGLYIVAAILIFNKI
jgi:homoserine/homoserine lactone efflux protein